MMSCIFYMHEGCNTKEKKENTIDVIISSSFMKRTKSTCHYDVLGIPKSASIKDIREAYLQKSKKVLYIYIFLK